MRKPKFEILVGKDDKVYFHLKASNGEILVSSRGYKTKSETIHAIASVMRYGQMDRYIVRRESVNGRHFFQIKSPSGRLLAWSETYQQKQGLETGIEAVKRAVSFGRVFDLN